MEAKEHINLMKLRAYNNYFCKDLCKSENKSSTNGQHIDSFLHLEYWEDEGHTTRYSVRPGKKKLGLYSSKQTTTNVEYLLEALN